MEMNLSPVYGHFIVNLPVVRSKCLCHLSYRDRLKQLGCSAWKREGLQGDLIVAFQCLKGSYKKEGNRHFSRVCGDRARENGLNLKKGTFRLDIRKKYFTVRVLWHWNSLLRDEANALSLETFMARLDQTLGSLI